MNQRPNLRWRPTSMAHDLRHIWNGKLLVFEKPVLDATYVLGVDTAQGRGKDRSVIEVLRVGDLQRPDTQVAEYATDAKDPKQFAEVVAAVGRLYHGRDDEALAVIERNTAGGGDLTLEDLRFRWGYTHLYSQKNLDSLTGVWSTTLGWYTGGTSRPKLALAGQHAINEGYVQLHSPLLLEELETFEGDGTIARAQAASGQYDDRVMAFFLAHWGAHEDEWLSGADTQRARLTMSPPPVDDSTHVRPRQDFQNTDTTLDDYRDRSESVCALLFGR